MLGRFEKFSMALFNISRYWNQLTTEEMKRQGLKGPYAFYLLTIMQHDGELTAAELSEMCGKDKADVSRALKNMEEKGFIERRSGQPYRARLKLTEEGKALAGVVGKRAETAVEIAGRDLTEEMRAVFYDALESISDNLRELSKNGIPE